MPTGPSTTDANGIRLYGEDDLIAALWSDFMNLGLASVSDAFTILKGRVSTAEDKLNNPTTYVAVDATARHTHWGTPTTASARRALQDKGAATARLDTGWTERYYAGLTDGGANPGGATVAGWYPITGKLPFVSLGMTTAQNFTNTGVNVAVAWDTELKDDLGWHDPAVNPSRITVKQAGRYRATRLIENNLTTASHYTAADFAVNGVLVRGSYSSYPVVSAVNFAVNMHSMDILCAANDYVEVRASTATGGTYAIRVADCLFQLEYLGPA